MRTDRIPLQSSLITRCLLSVALLTLLILGMAEFLNIRHLRHEAITHMQRDNRYISNITAQALALPLWNLDTTQIREQLQSLTRGVSFCGAQVHDMHGQLVVDVGFPAKPAPGMLIQAQPILFLDPTQDPPRLERIGQLQLCADSADTMQDLRHALIRQMVFMALVLLGVLVACCVSLMIIIRPLRKIRAAMAHLSNNMELITDPSLLKRNEIGALSRSFNSMVADLAQSYQALHAAKETAERADAAKSDFLANMTHELRTPLNSIIGMTTLLLERDLGGQEKEMLQVAHQSSGLLLEIVNDILDLSKIEAGEINLEYIGFDFNAVIERNALSMRHLAERKQIMLRCETDAALPYLLGDPLRVSQIVSNLVSNAIKYTDHGSVAITVTHENLSDGRVAVTCKVRDTGIGIPQEKLAHMFQKFMQVDASNSRRYGGTGLGLAITRQLVELLGGQVGVDSVMGAGSTFWFTIAFATSGAVQEDTGALLRRKRAAVCGFLAPAQAKILVAEDHPLNQAFIKLLLAKYGFVHIDLRENGRDILQAIAEKDYDLVLMDCFMPELNGYETTRAIRKMEAGTPRHLPIVAMTANAMMGDEQACLAAGMDDYIAKPVREEDFIAALSQWIKFAPLATPAEKPAPRNDASTTSAPVDLSILKTFSEGDIAIEKQLVGLFVVQSDLTLAKLEAACSDGICEDWVEAAHAFKGAAGGVGAEKLRLLCQQAQAMHQATADERQAMAALIRTHYMAVKDHLRQMGF